MTSISAIIITFNEERNIARCIDSVKEVADEIVVVDSYSTDLTETICKEKGVRFVRNRFDGHIEQKNFAISQSTLPYILSLDADEVLSEELRNSILAIKNNPVADGYYFNRLTNYCGKWIRHGGWYPDRKLRLFNRAKGKWGGENPHDKLILHKGSKEEFLKGDLLHYSYYSLEDHLEQVNKFTTIGAQSAFNNGRSVNWFSFLVKPVFKFFRDYVLRGGFLDGYYGFVIARISAHATYLKYAKLKELTRKK
jgi:glycosyltransferase involved in cell wall biosynthesis